MSNIEYIVLKEKADNIETWKMKDKTVMSCNVITILLNIHDQRLLNKEINALKIINIYSNTGFKQNNY